MEKMRMESVDMTEKNIEKIELLFPNCITEALDENGKLKKAINFELLKQMLSKEIIDGDEAYEFTWVGKKAAIVEANKPILGICRGAQIINTYFKGSLYQDLSYIGTEVLKHNQENSPSMVTHSVMIDKSSKLFDIFGEEKIRVNSFHHQAVKKVGDGLAISAKAPDGVIEAIEKTDYPFLVAVQWHPEMLHLTVEMMNKLFIRFIKEAANE